PLYRPRTLPSLLPYTTLFRSPYGVAKMAEVALARRYWLCGMLDVFVARTFNLIGPGQSTRFVCGSVAQQIAAIEHGEQEPVIRRSEEHTSELQSPDHLVCRLL